MAVDKGGWYEKRSSVLIVDNNLAPTMSSQLTSLPTVQYQMVFGSTLENSVALIVETLDTEALILQSDGAKMTETDLESLRSSIAMDSGDHCRV